MKFCHPTPYSETKNNSKNPIKETRLRGILDILDISKTKLNGSFPTGQFRLCITL